MSEIGSRVVIHNGLAYFSGHVDGKKHRTMREQAEALFARYDQLLSEVGSDKYHLLSATVYVSDMNLKEDFNAAWHEWQDRADCLPRRVCVQVVLDQGFFVEMSLIAEVMD